jgi:predicted secreted protein
MCTWIISFLRIHRLSGTLLVFVHTEKNMSISKWVVAAWLVLATSVQAQSVAHTTLVQVMAKGEVTVPNDLAVMVLMIEEQDKDKVAAASRVNQKLKQGTEIVRASDPKAELKTDAYYSYPIYQEQRPLQNGMTAKPVTIGWRVGQTLQVKTLNLAALPKTAAAAQRVLAINSVEFGLSPATRKSLDDQLVAAAYLNLNERIASIATVMGRKMSDAVFEEIQFEGARNYRGDQIGFTGSRSKSGETSPPVSEPSFAPGETTEQLQMGGKVRFK